MTRSVITGPRHQSPTSIIPAEDRLRLRKFPHNRLSLRGRPQGAGTAVLLDAVEKAPAQARLGGGVDGGVFREAEVKGPEQLRNADEQIALGQMDAGADASPGSVAVVVALVPLPGRGVHGRKGWIGFESLGYEMLGVLPRSLIMVHGPDVQHDGGAFGKEHAVDPVICEQQVRPACARQNSGDRLTFAQGVWDPEWADWSPSMTFFDDHVDVREFGKVRPFRRAIIPDRSVDLGLGSGNPSLDWLTDDGQNSWSPFLYLGIGHHGQDDGQNQ